MQNDRSTTANGGWRGRPLRRSVRRALAMECSIECENWDGTVSLPATDISDDGLWIETEVALNPGDDLVVSFQLPGAPLEERIWATARVARIGLWRRRDDVNPSGMGLAFTYCSEADRRRLQAFLVGRPPPLPPVCVRRTAREVEDSMTLLPPSGEQLLPPVLDVHFVET